jgi:DNA-binding NarL/FixJ family response regulator
LIFQKPVFIGKPKNTMNKIKLLIADDHAVVRKGLMNLLEDEANIEIIGEATDGLEAIEQVKKLKPNVVLLDITMPKMSGIDAAKVIAEKYAKTYPLVFSMHNNQEYMLHSVANGAMGYLLKDSSKEEILTAIATVSEGKKYFPPNVSATIIEGLLAERSQQTASNKMIKSALSKQERVILNYIIEGLSSQEISEKLNLSVRTVSNHRANMMKKVNAKNTADLVKMAMG